MWQSTSNSVTPESEHISPVSVISCQIVQSHAKLQNQKSGLWRGHRGTPRKMKQSSPRKNALWHIRFAI